MRTISTMTLHSKWLGVVFAGALMVFGISAGAAEKKVPATGAEVYLSFAPLAKKTAPAVVNIYARKILEDRPLSPLFNNPFFRQFFNRGFGQDRQRKRFGNSLGSGVIVRADGLIVTNKHVVDGADQINVVLADRREFSAKLVLTDDKTDLAILQVDPKGVSLPKLELSDSDTLEVGDLVLAIGNPFGVGQTVTSGIVSALARTQVMPTDLNFFIQTDAAINPGNSGGALVSMDGKLVGVNTAIFSKNGGSLGIGFAIPSNMVRAVITGMRKDGRLVRAWLGARGQAVTQDIASSLGMDRPSGVLVNKVYKGGAAGSAGLRVGDVVLAVDGHKVDEPKALRYRIATLPVGGKATLSVRRQKTTLSLEMKLTPPPEDPPRNITLLSGEQPLSGAKVANVSPALAIELGLDPFAKGVMIVGIHRNSTAIRLGFQVGDIVHSINGKNVKKIDGLKPLLSVIRGRWIINIVRKGKSLNLVING